MLIIKTPEGVMFSQVLAGPVSRCLAWIIDVLCIQVVLTVLGFGAGMLGVVSANIAFALYFIAYFAITIGYGILFEWFWRGQTIGKRLFRLRVVDVEGMRLQFNQIVIRNLLRFVDSLPLVYLVGGVTCWLSPKAQRLGDIAGNTVVIRQPLVHEPDFAQVMAGKFNSLRHFPHLVARLRQNVSPAEAAIALQSLLRREEFDAVARVELYEHLASHFRAKVEFPAEATDGVADEQFLRNVVDVVFQSAAQPQAGPA